MASDNIRDNLQDAAKGMDRQTVAKLLGHIEKHSANVADVESLLWALLDEIDSGEPAPMNK